MRYTLAIGGKMIMGAIAVRLNNGGFYISDINADGRIVINRFRSRDGKSYNELVNKIND